MPAQRCPFHQPGAGDAQDNAERDAERHQQQGVEEELADALAEDQPDGGFPPRGDGHHDDVPQRDEGKEGNEYGDDGYRGNAERRAGALAPTRRRRTSGSVRCR
ncbi:hypothetical protein D3C84_1095590 [compost metagenome]